MLRFIVIVVLTSFLTIPTVFAGHKGEFGALFGFSRYLDRDDLDLTEGISAVNVPEILYIMWFPSERVSIGPEVTITDRGENSPNLQSFGCRINLFFSGSLSHQNSYYSEAGPYLIIQSQLAALTVRSIEETAFVLGSGFGYQWRIGRDYVFRMESRYRQSFGTDDLQINEISLSFGLGVRLDVSD